RSAAERDVRLFDNAALTDPRPGHLHDGVQALRGSARRDCRSHHPRQQERVDGCRGGIDVAMCSSELYAPRAAFRAAGGDWSTLIIWAKNTVYNNFPTSASGWLRHST